MKIPTFERRNEIIRMLQEHGYVKAQMLAKQYQVSMETIRKDLTFLEAKTDRWNLGNWLSGYWQTTYALLCQTETKVIKADGKRVGFGNAF